ncbi:MAG: hypothetical protein ACOVN5_10990 [Aquidulcibacter sp.]
MSEMSRQKLISLYLKAIDNELSRTARTGAVATSVNRLKRPARLAGDELHSAMTRNRELAAEYIDWRAEEVPTRAEEMLAALTGLAVIVNFGILSGDLYRSWPYTVPTVGERVSGHEVAPDKIMSGLYELAQECVEIAKLGTDLKPRAVAQVEWKIGIGPLHPFYDGCGRISRYFTTLLCLWSDVELRVHRSRTEYMAAATAGEAAFIQYWILSPTRIAQ